MSDFHQNALLPDYLDTDYCVDDAPGGPFRIRCGQLSERADQLLAIHACEVWYYITACNPQSYRLNDAENARRQDQLESRLKALNLAYFSGAGIGIRGNWPPEPSFFILGLDERTAIQLGLDFDQHAILSGRKGEPAELIWMSSPRTI
jgi:Protein of unknown function (DUF3293)